MDLAFACGFRPSGGGDEPAISAICQPLADLGGMRAGVALIRRTTRRSQPTGAGMAFYARVKFALTEIDHARGEAAIVRARAPDGSG